MKKNPTNTPFPMLGNRATFADRLARIESMVRERGSGAAVELSRDLAVGHYKPINSDRFVNDCHEFIFHFTPEGRTPL